MRKEMDKADIEKLRKLAQEERALQQRLMLIPQERAYLIGRIEVKYGVPENVQANLNLDEGVLIWPDLIPSVDGKQEVTA